MSYFLTFLILYDIIIHVFQKDLTTHHKPSPKNLGESRHYQPLRIDAHACTFGLYFYITVVLLQVNGRTKPKNWR